MGSFKNYITSFWKGLLSLLKGMGVTGKYFFSRKVTEQYPENRATLNCPNGTIKKSRLRKLPPKMVRRNEC